MYTYIHIHTYIHTRVLWTEADAARCRAVQRIAEQRSAEQSRAVQSSAGQSGSVHRVLQQVLAYVSLRCLLWFCLICLPRIAASACDAA